MSGTNRETHLATVIANDDPQKRGRLKLASATLLGVDDNGEVIAYPDWVDPVFPALQSDNTTSAVAGLIIIPSSGVTVELEISVSSETDQVPGQTLITDPDPRWKASILEEGDTFPALLKENYPNRSGYVSPAGHALVFDDQLAGGVPVGPVFLQHAVGTKLLFTPEGKISIGNAETNVELLALIDQLLTALKVFTTATKAAAIEPTLAPSSIALEVVVTTVQTALATIKV